MESCKASSIHKRIIYCNTRYNILVRKEGIKLLNSKCQYITIIKAFLKNLKILLLDKAISAINNIMEKSICKSLKSQRKDRTILIITYHLSTVKGANKIIFLKNREIKKKGSYTKLLN